MCGVNLFIYQLLDNLDGRQVCHPCIILRHTLQQARRTGSSGPLGELFDHGCDSLFLMVSLTGSSFFDFLPHNQQLTSIPLLMALGIGPVKGTHMLLTGLVVFYTAHWEEYHRYQAHIVLNGLSFTPVPHPSIFVAHPCKQSPHPRSLCEPNRDPMSHDRPFLLCRDFWYSSC